MSLNPIFTEEQALQIVSEYGQSLTDFSAPDGQSQYEFAQIRWNKSAAWLFWQLGLAVERARTHAYPFTYAGFGEPLLLMRFTGGKQSVQGWRMDCGRGAASNRKLTLTVELNGPGGYAGGDIEVWGPDGLRTSNTRQLGEVICWPSYALHRTLPVTHGVRWALRAFLTGPAFV